MVGALLGAFVVVGEFREDAVQGGAQLVDALFEGAAVGLALAVGDEGVGGVEGAGVTLGDLGLDPGRGDAGECADGSR